MGNNNKSGLAESLTEMNGDPGKLPLVSIGLPVYNGSRWIDDSIRSFVNQTYQNIELIICDNCSTDSTPSICETWAANDPRIQFFRNEKNIGLIPNHNLVFRHARGEYFVWGSYDDLHHAESISSMVAELQARPELVLVYTRAESIDESGTISTEKEMHVPLNSNSVSTRAKSLLADFAPSETIFYGVMRREAMQRTSLLPNCFGADFIFLLQLVTLGKMDKIPRVLFYRRVHANNVITSQEQPWRFRSDWSGKLIFPQWRILTEGMKCALRARISIGEKLRLLSTVVRFSWNRKSLLKTELGFAWYYTKQRLRGNNPTLSPADRQRHQEQIQSNGLTH